MIKLIVVSDLSAEIPSSYLQNTTLIIKRIQAAKVTEIDASKADFHSDQYFD